MQAAMTDATLGAFLGIAMLFVGAAIYEWWNK